MDSFVGGLMGRVIHRFPEVIKILAVAALVVAVTTLFALLKARHIKKFPPVVAFRKGIKTHSFRKNFFPLEKTGNNINVRLAFKSFFRNIMTNIGTGLCIVLAGTAMMFAVAGWDFFKESDAIMHCMGIEVADERIQPLDGVDAYELADELLAFPGVRKTMVTYNIEQVSVVGNRSETFAMVYEDFSETENIFVSEGRLPEHDNEVAISLKRHNTDGLNVGDSITLEGDGTRKSYVITGIVPAMGNNGMNIYMTNEAFLRCNPNARPDVVEVFLEEGVDRAEFERQITGVYGASAQDAAEAASQGGTLEDRIRSAADAQMATLISRYGVTDIDYAIVIGDQVITGRSSGFVIKEMNSFLELSKSQMEPIANMFKVFCGAGAIFVSIVVAAILAIIAASNIRRQRKDLGIMKSMGYTSKDLMKQLALSMLPTTVVSSAISIVIGSIVYKLFWVAGFGCINNPNLLIMIITAILLVVFCYIVTYLAAGKIKHVSVTELMTE
jgi:predicted lysophospholipase L1 biosynthesis ABC-type transport system permease subunit